MVMFSPREHQGDGGNYDLLAVGTYVCRIRDAERKRRNDDELRNGKYDFIRAQFEVYDGEQKGARFGEIFSLSEKALFRLSALCIGVAQVEAFDIDDDDAIRHALVGKLVKVTTKNEWYEGKEQTRVDQIMSMSAEERAKLSGKNGTGDAFDPAPSRRSAEDDSIPF